jgi:hypothetical protein
MNPCATYPAVAPVILYATTVTGNQCSRAYALRPSTADETLRRAACETVHELDFDLLRSCYREHLIVHALNDPGNVQVLSPAQLEPYEAASGSIPGSHSLHPGHSVFKRLGQILATIRSTRRFASRIETPTSSELRMAFSTSLNDSKFGTKSVATSHWYCERIPRTDRGLLPAEMSAGSARANSIPASPGCGGRRRNHRVTKALRSERGAGR